MITTTGLLFSEAPSSIHKHEISKVVYCVFVGCILICIPRTRKGIIFYLIRFVCEVPKAFSVDAKRIRDDTELGKVSNSTNDGSKKRILDSERSNAHCGNIQEAGTSKEYCKQPLRYCRCHI